jgi:hypothetical protein
MAQQIQGKTILLILGLIVFLFLVSMYRGQIFDFFNQLPGYQDNEDKTIIPDKDDLAYVGGCNPPVARIISGKWIVISIEEAGEKREVQTDVYFKSPDIIGIHKKGILIDHTVGKVTSPYNQIKIEDNIIKISDYGEINNLALEIIQNKYLSQNSNDICKAILMFKCGSYNSLEKPSVEEIKKYQDFESVFKENSQNPPNLFDEQSFRALLVAFSEKESWSFNENEISELSISLHNALSNNEEKYLSCNQYEGGEKMMCIASVYKLGEYSQNNEIGISYANELFEIHSKWQTYFCNPKIFNLVKEEPTTFIGRTIEKIKNLLGISNLLGSKERGKPIEYIILHHTGGSTFDSAYQTFLRSRKQLSVHYVVDKDGIAYYLIDESRKAYHARDYNEETIGIEIVNTGYSNDDYTKEQYETLNMLLEQITKKWGIPYDDAHIVGHYERTSSSAGKWDPSPNFEWGKIGLPNHSPVQLSASDEEKYGYA